MTFLYKPPPTVRAFMRSEALVRVIVGPVGSGKTTGCLFEILRRSYEQKPDAKGYRRTRWAIIRNTMNQLRTTVLPDMRQYYGTLCEWRVSQSTMWLKIALKDGTFVEAELLFIPLEEEDDIRRLLSLQLTGAFIEELRETEHKILSPLLGRIGRFPSVDVKSTWQGIIASTNPWPDGSPWQETFEIIVPEGYTCFRQPSGLSADAENIENLPEGYYQRLCEGASQEFINVSVHGKNGQDMSGSAVFRDTFDYHTHTIGDTRVWEERQFLIGLDVDRNPAAIIGQRTPTGQLVIHQELYYEGMGIEAFISSELTPMMYERFPGHAFIICDPAAVRRSSISEESTQQAIQRLGYDVALAPTNKIEPRLRSVEQMLMTANKGEPQLILSRAGAPMLIQALMNGYKFNRSQKGELAPKPEKTHPYSDLADALQYLCLGFGSAKLGRVIGRGRSPIGNRTPMPPPPPVGGWT